MRGKKITRQLQKTFGSDEAEQELKRLSEWLRRQSTLPEPIRGTPRITAAFPEFLDAVEGAYEQYEQILRAANQSVELSSQGQSDNHSRLESLNRSIQALLNSLGQGFLVFGRDGICTQIHSRACLDLFECEPAGKPIQKVLRVPEFSHDEFSQWLEMLFNEVIDFEDLAVLGPGTFPHSQDHRWISLEFKPIRAIDESIQGVVVIATDRTIERKVQREADEQQQKARMVVKLVRDRNQFVAFLKEARVQISMLQGHVDPLEARRLLHTFKGGAASFHMNAIRNMAHGFEDDLERATAANSTRVELEEKLHSYGSALETALDTFLGEHQDILGADLEHEGFLKQISLQDLYSFARHFDEVPGSGELKKRFLETIVAVPLKQLIARYDSDVQQLAGRLRKKAKLIAYRGEDVRVLPDAYEEFFANLVHLFRNAIDHGLEIPEDRLAMGKDPAGAITVTVESDAAPPGSAAARLIRMTFEDDGKGIDIPRLRGKLMADGDLMAAVQETSQSLLQRIFEDGISTSDQITDVSGRGVGLSALKASVVRLQGTIEVSTRSGLGTKFVIVLPHLWTPMLGA